MGKLDCGVRNALDTIGGKWSTLIIRDLLRGDKRFSELQDSLTDIAAKTLSENLKRLEQNKIIHREVFAETPPRVLYSLTAYGKKLEKVIDALKEWGELQPPTIESL